MSHVRDPRMLQEVLRFRSAPAPLWRDIAIALVAAMAIGWLSAAFQLHEAVFNWSRRWEGIQLDEWPVAVFAFATFLLGLYAVRHRQLRAALRDNQRLAQEALAAQEAERRRLARELHDELGQYLNAIQLDAGAVAVDAGSAPLQEAASRISANVTHVYGVVSDLVRRLRPAALDELGLVAALEACVDRVRAQHPQLVVHQLCTGNCEGLGESINLAVYRIVQEALTNAVRHSSSAVLEIALEVSADTRSLELRVADQGVGCDAREALAAGGGLAGMRERVQLLGGRFELLSQSGQGTTLRIGLPVAAAS